MMLKLCPAALTALAINFGVLPAIAFSLSACNSVSQGTESSLETDELQCSNSSAETTAEYCSISQVEIGESRENLGGNKVEQEQVLQDFVQWRKARGYECTELENGSTECVGTFASDGLSSAQAIEMLTDRIASHTLLPIQYPENGQNSALASVHYNRGKFYGALRQYEDAANDFNRAIYLDSSRAEYHNALGVAYRHLGRYQEAASAFSEGLQIDPSNDVMRSNLEAALAETPTKSDSSLLP